VKQLAFATSDSWPQLTADDRLAVAPLRDRGIGVSPAVWSDPGVDWSSFDAIVVRSTWDYHKRIEEFRAWIDGVEGMGSRVWNPCPLLRWNADKRYLLDLASRGIPIVPTSIVPASSTTALREVMDQRGWDDVVIKPTVSATAYGMRRLRRREVVRAAENASGSVVDERTATGDVLVQPFLDEIATAGEWSLMFFGGGFSHSVRKRPMRGDFRVQTEYGGSSIAEPAPSAVITAAEAALAAVTEPWLYARVDGVETADGFLLMELEMLEPLLFLDLDPRAPERFAEAIASSC
jgi:glutathione synthase/RimK-type ligase-like ATP-grasp enzyme